MLALAVERIGSDYGSGQLQAVQQRPELDDVVDRVTHVGLATTPSGSRGSALGSIIECGGSGCLQVRGQSCKLTGCVAWSTASLSRPT
jgi:hypothetical protein